METLDTGDIWTNHRVSKRKTKNKMRRVNKETVGADVDRRKKPLPEETFNYIPPVGVNVIEDLGTSVTTKNALARLKKFSETQKEQLNEPHKEEARRVWQIHNKLYTHNNITHEDWVRTQLWFFLTGEKPDDFTSEYCAEGDVVKIRSNSKHCSALFLYDDVWVSLHIAQMKIASMVLAFQKLIDLFGKQKLTEDQYKALTSAISLKINLNSCEEFTDSVTLAAKRAANKLRKEKEKAKLIVNDSGTLNFGDVLQIWLYQNVTREYLDYFMIIDDYVIKQTKSCTNISYDECYAKKPFLTSEYRHTYIARLISALDAVITFSVQVFPEYISSIKNVFGQTQKPLDNRKIFEVIKAGCTLNAMKLPVIEVSSTGAILTRSVVVLLPNISFLMQSILVTNRLGVLIDLFKRTFVTSRFHKFKSDKKGEKAGVMAGEFLDVDEVAQRAYAELFAILSCVIDYKEGILAFKKLASLVQISRVFALSVNFLNLSSLQISPLDLPSRMATCFSSKITYKLGKDATYVKEMAELQYSAFGLQFNVVDKVTTMSMIDGQQMGWIRKLYDKVLNSWVDTAFGMVLRQESRGCLAIIVTHNEAIYALDGLIHLRKIGAAILSSFRNSSSVKFTGEKDSQNVAIMTRVTTISCAGLKAHMIQALETSNRGMGSVMLQNYYQISKYAANNLISNEAEMASVITLGGGSLISDSDRQHAQDLPLQLRIIDNSVVTKNKSVTDLKGKPGWPDDMIAEDISESHSVELSVVVNVDDDSAKHGGVGADNVLGSKVVVVTDSENPDKLTNITDMTVTVTAPASAPSQLDVLQQEIVEYNSLVDAEDKVSTDIEVVPPDQLMKALSYEKQNHPRTDVDFDDPEVMKVIQKRALNKLKNKNLKK